MKNYLRRAFSGLFASLICTALSLAFIAESKGAVTTNLGMTYLNNAQAQPDVPINDAWNKLDLAASGLSNKLALTITTNLTLTNAQTAQNPWILGGAPASNITITTPASTSFVRAIYNNTGKTVTIIPSGGTGYTMPIGASAIVFSDGSTAYQIGATAGGSFASPTFSGTVTLPGTNQTINSTYWLIGFASNSSSDLIQVNGTIAAIHFHGISSAPSAAAGTGAGTGGTCAVSGNDSSGQITVVTGTLPTAGATVCTITYSVAYSSATHPILSAANSGTALLTGVTMIYADGTTTTAVLTAGTSALGAGTFKWNYVVIQ